MSQLDGEGEQTGARPPAALGVVLALVGSLCAIYMVSQFLRNSVGVLAPELAREVSLSPAEIGLLSSIFFLSFSAVQIPLGIALDRWGARVCMLVSVGLALAGSVVFSRAETFEVLVLARMLMGLGCSSFFMAPLTIYARWFPGDRFATLAGLQLGFGTIGTILATAPLAYASALIGWRTSFLVVAVLAAAAGLLVLVFVRDHPPGARRDEAKAESLRDNLRGVAEAVRVPSMWPVLAIHFAGYSSFIVLLGLWGGPYLSDVHGLGIERRGEFLLVLAIANVIGTMAYGPMDRILNSRKLPVLCGAGATACMLALLATVSPPLPVLGVMFALAGFVAGFVSVYTAHGRALFPDHLVGRGITFLNMGTMFGVFFMQTATGLIVGLFEADSRGALPFEAYQACFGFAALCLAVAAAIYGLSEDRPPRSL